MSTQYNDILSGMPSITLDQMESVRLLNRIESKYLTEEGTLRQLLDRAAAMGYMVFENGGSRVLEYRSMYYDTPGLQMYLDHHDRRLVRQKLRTRCYVASGVTFLELKSKNNHGRTKKKRFEISREMYCQQSLDDAVELQWLSDKFTYPTGCLTPSLETRFSRITLVNPEFTERTTIDMDLSLSNVRNGVAASLSPLAVIEVKQDGNAPSRIREILLDLRVKPIRISKYCIGIALTAGEVKRGRFKPKTMIINKMKEQYDSSTKCNSCGK